MRWFPLCSTTALFCLVTPLSAQLPADRPFFDSLITQLAGTTATKDIPQESRCAGRSTDATRLCQGMLASRRGELLLSAEEARRADDLLTRSATDHENWPVAWYGLGINRLSLARLKVFSHEGPLLPVGISNEAGGANALVQALKLDPSYRAAANALAFSPLSREGSSALKDRVALLRQTRSLLTPEGCAMTATFEREAGNVDSAIALQRRALATGRVDSGVVQLDMARNLYRIGAPAAGHAALVAGAATTSKASIAAYRAELTWVASPKELTEWDSLPATERSAWIAAFWSRRDVADGRKDGERLIEHYRRIEYAMAHYRITLPQTGRQRALSTSESGEYHDENEARKVAIGGHSTAPPPVTRNMEVPAGAVTKEMLNELSTFVAMSRTEGTEASKRYYRPIQDQIDDRGIAYIRQGPPDKVATSTGGESLELWRYDRATGPILLHFREADFDGSSDATVLVPTFITLPIPMRNQVCYLEPTECPLSQRFQAYQTARGMGIDDIVRALAIEVHAEGEHLAPESIVRSAKAGKKSIDLATTTDAFPLQFTHKVVPSVQIFGLDRASGGAPRLVVAFAIPGDQLAHATQIGGEGRTIYPVRLQLMAARERDGFRVDLDTLRQFATTTPLTDKQYLSGTIELPASPGSYGVSLVVTQADGRGAVAHLGTVVVPSNSARLAVSDLVLGRDGSGSRWNSGSTVVSLNPLNAWPMSGGAEVYFQLSGLVPGESYTTRYELFRSTDDPKHPPRLTISGSQVARDSRVEISRTLGLTNLEPGSYRVVLTVSGGGKSATAAGWMTIVK